MTPLHELNKNTWIDSKEFQFRDREGKLIERLKFVGLDGMYAKLVDESNTMYRIAAWHNVNVIGDERQS